jgi:acetyl esterase
MLTALLATTAVYASSSPQAREPEGNYIVPGVRAGIVYRTVSGQELCLDAYVQRRGQRRPAVLVLHGGGWRAGSRVAFVGQFLELLTRAGYNWFSVDYRLGPVANYGNALEDVRAALAFVRENAPRFGVDRNRIALLGEDSGAQLAALLGAEKPRGLKAVVLVGGFYDLTAVPALKDQDRALLSRASPAKSVVAGMPETFVVHGAADREVPPEQATAFCDALRAAGDKCVYLPVENGIHRAENWRPDQWGYKEHLSGWLSNTLGLSSPDHEPWQSNLQKDIQYNPASGLKLDAYVPNGKGPFPAVVIAHGGGWEAGDKVTYVTPVFAPLARAGFAWFSIDYRLTPQSRNPDQIEDLRSAVLFVRENARKFRVDPQRIAILGESASGQMVAQLAAETAADTAPFAVAVSFYGVYDFAAMATDASPRSIPARLFGLTALDDAAKATLRRYSPLHNVHGSMVPLLLIHGTNERLWAQGTAMATALAEAGVEHELYRIEGAPHGMENWEGRAEWQGYKDKLVAWLRAHLPPVSERP